MVGTCASGGHIHTTTVSILAYCGYAGGSMTVPDSCIYAASRMRANGWHFALRRVH
jgi:hypothetical protein